MHVWRRVLLVAALAGSSYVALGVTVASSRAAQHVQDLAKATQGTTVPRLVVGTTYGASLVDPTPNLTPGVRGWAGGQLVSHQSGKVRYESAIFFWEDGDHEVDIVSGPAMSMSPTDTLAKPLSRHFNFAPYQPPSPVKKWTVAGHQAIYFDATAPPPGEWTVIGSNPPELRIDHDYSFRMAALTVRGKTVVLVIRAPAVNLKQFLPIAGRLLASLRFPSS